EYLKWWALVAEPTLLLLGNLFVRRLVPSLPLPAAVSRIFHFADIRGSVLRQPRSISDVVGLALPVRPSGGRNHRATINGDWQSTHNSFIVELILYELFHFRVISRQNDSLGEVTRLVFVGPACFDEEAAEYPPARDLAAEFCLWRKRVGIRLATVGPFADPTRELLDLGAWLGLLHGLRYDTVSASRQGHKDNHQLCPQKTRPT